MRNTGERYICEDFWLVYCLEPHGVKDSSPGNDLCKLHCGLFYCTEWHCTVLHCTALFDNELHCSASHGTVRHCTAQHYTALDEFGGVLYSPLFNISMTSMGFKDSHYSIELAVCCLLYEAELVTVVSLWGGREGFKEGARDCVKQ